MRSLPGSWTTTLARLGFKRQRRRRQTTYGRRLSIEPRKLLSATSFESVIDPLGGRELEIEVAPVSYKVGAFALTSDDWTGRNSGGDVKRSEAGLGIGSDAPASDPDRFNPGESWSFRFDQPGYLLGIQLDEFSIDDADRAVLIVGNNAPIKIEAGRVVDGYWQAWSPLAFEAGETIRLEAVAPTQEDLSAALAKRREQEDSETMAGGAALGDPPTSAWRVMGLQVLGRDDSTYGGYLDLTKPPADEAETFLAESAAAYIPRNRDLPADRGDDPSDEFIAMGGALTADVQVTGFTVPYTGGGYFRVSYNLSENLTAPFDIHIYRSGSSTELMSHEVTSGSNRWVAGSRFVDIQVNFVEWSGDYILSAKAVIDDANQSNNTATFSGGLFQNSDGAIHYHGPNSTAQDNFEAYSYGGAGYGYIKLNGGDPIQFEGGFSELRVRTHGGNDTILLDDDDNLGARLWAWGGDGNDTITGSHGVDYLRGGLGNDNLYGNGGDDQLHGDEGRDTIYGGDGHDRIEGGGPTSGVYGNYLYGGWGDDLIEGGWGADWIDGGAGDDVIQGGDDVPQEPTAPWEEGGGYGGGYFDGGGGDYILGGDGDDVIYAGDGNDYVDGGAGNDWIDGYTHDDYLVGGADDDWLQGGEGDDLIEGGDGSDFLVGGVGDDVLDGGAGVDDFGPDNDNTTSQAPQSESIANVNVRRAQDHAVRLLANDANEDSFTFSVHSVSGPQALNQGGIIDYSLTSDGIFRWIGLSNPAIGTYTFTIKVTDSTSLTDTESFDLVLAGYNAFPPTAGNLPTLATWSGLSIDRGPLESETAASIGGSDTQTPNGNFTFGGELDANGWLNIDWSEYIETGARKIIEIIDDGVDGAVSRLRKYAVYIWQEDQRQHPDHEDREIWYKPGLARDDRFYTNADSEISVDLGFNDIKHPIQLVNGGAWKHPIFSEPTLQHGTIKPNTFDSTTGSFVYVPDEGFEGLETFTYTFQNPTIWLTEYIEDSPYDVSYVQSNGAVVYIEVGRAVKANLLIEGLDEEEENNGYGTLMALNDNDQNKNNREDRYDIKQAVSGESDLTEVIVEYELRADAESDDFMATFSATSTNLIRLWMSPNKSEEIALYDLTTGDTGKEFKLSQLPERVYVEAFDRGSTALVLSIIGSQESLFKNMVWHGSSAATTASAALLLTPGVGMTAHRPMQGPDTYNPFEKTRVPENVEWDSKHGPGIRMNWDHDNGGTAQDRTIIDGTVIPGENDLIDVRIDAPPGVTNLILEAQLPLRLFTSHEGGTALAVTEHTSGRFRTFPLTLINGVTTVYVEWSGNPGHAELKLYNGNNNLMIDRLLFHTFEGIAAVLGGRTQAPSNPLPKGYGIFDVGVQLYGSGYDVYMYNENEVGDDGAGDPYDEIVAAIEDRLVSQVAIIGYSWGGGATYSLSKRLDDNRAQIVGHGAPFQIKLTTYVDAIQRGSGNPQTVRPPGSQFHLNLYQQFDQIRLRGAPTVPIIPGFNIDVNVNWNGLGARHRTIDDFTQVKNRIILEVNNQVKR